MRIGFVRYKYTPFGGAERIIDRLISALSDYSEIESIVLFTSNWRDFNSFDHKKFLVKDISNAGVGRLWQRLSFLQNLKAAMTSDGNLDIIQSHERIVGADIFRAGDGVHRAWIDRRSKEMSPLQSRLMNLDPYHRHIVDTEIKISRDPRTCFVANSPLAYRDLVEYLDIPEGRMKLIPNSLEYSQWTKYRLTEDEKRNSRRRLKMDPEIPTLAFVGSGFNRKGLATVLEVMAIRKHCQLAVVGYDKSAVAFQEMASRLCPNRAFFYGPKTTVGEILGSSDVFILPSKYDSFSNAALEALAVGLPVITSPFTGLADYIRIHGGGVVADNNSEAMAHAVDTVLARLPDHRMQAISLGMQFDHSKVIPLWLDLYRETVKNKGLT